MPRFRAWEGRDVAHSLFASPFFCLLLELAALMQHLCTSSLMTDSSVSSLMGEKGRTARQISSESLPNLYVDL